MSAPRLLFRCPACTLLNEASADLAGLDSRCRFCGEPLRIPAGPGENATRPMEAARIDPGATCIGAGSRPLDDLRTVPAEEVNARPCPYCSESIAVSARKCPHCHELIDAGLRHELAAGRDRRSRANHSPVAAALSLFVPGLGQLVRGQFAAGFGWFMLVGIGYLLLLVPGFILHLVCVLDAYHGQRDDR